MNDASLTLDMTGEPGQHDFATLYATVADSKGLKPTLRLNPPTSSVASIVQFIPNEGADPEHPKDEFPWVGSVNAQSPGSVKIEIWSDGCCTDTLPMTVRPPQKAFVPVKGIVITKAAPSP